MARMLTCEDMISSVGIDCSKYLNVQMRESEMEGNRVRLGIYIVAVTYWTTPSFMVDG